jgi:hypothetical protein
MNMKLINDESQPQLNQNVQITIKIGRNGRVDNAENKICLPRNPQQLFTKLKNVYIIYSIGNLLRYTYF